jgi:putative ABC transport system permease protein
MGFLRDGLMRLYGSLRRKTVDQDLNDEVQFHIDMQIEKNLRLGMSPDEARRTALIAFGGRERFKEDARDEARSRLLEDFVQDLRYGLRMLRRSPAFTAIAVLSLALGIGANTAVFSVVNAVLLQPLPYADPGRLVVVGITDAAHEDPGSFSVADLRAVEQQARSFSAIGVTALGARGFTLTGFGSSAEQIDGTLITSGLIPALGVPPLMGRASLPAEEKPGSQRTVVVSHRFWREKLNASGAAIGQQLMLDGEPNLIVGVMPAGFTLPNLPDDQLWPVLQLDPPEYRAPFYLRTFARLAPGVSRTQAIAELQTLATAVKAQYPASQPHWTYAVEDLKTSLVGDSRPIVLTLYAAVALILLMASANVANLFLARATTRLPELAVRTALGAGRTRLMRQLVTESTLVAILGAVLGLVIAYWGVRFLSAAMPGGMPHVRAIRIDLVVLAFTAGIAVISGIAIGLVPALHLPREGVSAALRDGSRGSPGAERRRVSAALVVGEFALALTVLVGAGLAVNSLIRLQRVDAGVRKEGLLVVRLAVPEARYDTEEKVDGFFDEAMRRVTAIPGVSSAAVSMAVPPHRLVMTNPYTPEGKTYAAGESAPLAEELLVSPDYFATLDIPLRRGRAFTAADRDGAPRVAIINETLARSAFPGKDAVGRWLQTGDPDPAADKITIVGVVPDVKYSGLDAHPEPTIYVPYKQALWWRSMYMIMRTNGDPLSHVPAVRAALSSLDAEIPLREARTMDRLIGESVAEPRYRAMLLSAFGALALILSSAGIYGVMSYTVSQRRKETGVRLALGATSADVMRLVIRDGMRLAVIGVVCGIVLALLSTRVLASMLFGVSPIDPLTFGAMAIFLTAVGLAACMIPARRASRTDPMTAIRAE